MKKPMKIAFISQVFDGVVPPEQNSVGIWTYHTARELAQTNEVLVVSRRGPKMPSRMDLHGIQFEFVRCIPGRVWSAIEKIRRGLYPNLGPFFARQYYLRDYVVQCIRRLRDFRPDVIHIHNFVNHLPALRKAFPDATLVIHMHCDWLHELDQQSVRVFLQSADLVVGCSDHVVRNARDRFPDLSIPFEELPNGVDLTASQARPDNPRDNVLFVGRVSPEKGVHVLIEAWRKVKSTRPSAELKIVGPMETCPKEMLVDLSNDPDVRALSRHYPDRDRNPGSYEEQLRAMLPADLAESVTFTGSAPHDRVMKMYAHADVVANPSLSEAFGMSLVEALLSGTPVVASRAGGMEEIVEKTKGGIVVKKADADALADAIVTLLEDPDRRKKMGQHGRAKVLEFYSWKRIGQTANALYRKSARKSS